MNTKNALDHAYAHWLKDGIFEIGLGILLAGVGTLRALIHFAGSKTAAYYWLSGVLLLFMIGSVLVSKRVGEALKARITYPRTGFMAFKPFKFNLKNILAWLVLLILGGILGVMVGMLATRPGQQRVGVIVPITMSIVGALAFIIAGWRFKLKRFYYLAAISIGLGLVISALGVGVVLGLAFFYLSIGLVLAATGSVALVQFLRSHKPVDLNGESQ